VASGGNQGGLVVEGAYHLEVAQEEGACIHPSYSEEGEQELWKAEVREEHQQRADEACLLAREDSEQPEVSRQLIRASHPLNPS